MPLTILQALRSFCEESVIPARLSAALDYRKEVMNQSTCPLVA